MKVAFVVPCRNKEKQVAACVRSVLMQTYSPMELIFSDQGSEDDSLAVICDEVRQYRGPNVVRVMQCPDTEPRGMAGLNAHLNWIHNQTDADIFIQSSADDIAYPDRSARVVEAFEKHSPSMVATGQHFAHPDGQVYGYTGSGLVTGFHTPRKVIESDIGGSASMAWSRKFYEQIGGTYGPEITDLMCGYLAAMCDGFYYIDEPLHAYIAYQDPQNMGIEGRIRAADEAGKIALTEVAAYQISHTLCRMCDRADRLSKNGIAWADDAKNALYERLMNQCYGWAHARRQLDAKGIRPLNLEGNADQRPPVGGVLPEVLEADDVLGRWPFLHNDGVREPRTPLAAGHS